MNKSEQYLDHIQKTKSKDTFFNYKGGFLKFLEWTGKDADAILAEHRQNLLSDDPTKKDFYKNRLEEFARDMINKGYKKNSARVFLDGPKNFFSYYGLPVKVSREYTKVIASSGDYVPTIDEFRRMFNCADIRGKTVLAMGLSFGFRIGDFLPLRKDQIPDLEKERPIPFDLVTHKEDVIAKTFLSGEVAELLKAYVPTLKTENPFLWQSNSEHCLTDTALNDLLKALAAKSKISIPANKRLRFHCFRKRFLSTCADLRIDVNLAKIMCGKTVDSSMLTYLSEADLKKSFLDVAEHLNLSNGTMKTEIHVKEEEIRRLAQELEETKGLLKAMTELFGKEILEKAKEQQIEAATPLEVLSTLRVKAEVRVKEEYKKLIENGNSDNGNETK